MSDHGLPSRIGDGTLSRATVVWTYVLHGRTTLRFEWDMGHTLEVFGPDGRVDTIMVGDPAKVTTSRRTVENVIRRYIAGE